MTILATAVLGTALLTTPARAQGIRAIQAPYTSTMPIEFDGGHRLEYCPGGIPVTWEVRIENPSDAPWAVVFSDDLADGLNGDRLELVCPPVLLPPGVDPVSDVTCGSPGASELEVRNIVVPPCGRAILRYDTVISSPSFEYICSGGTVRFGSSSARTVPPIDDQRPDPPPLPSDPSDTCIYVSSVCDPLNRDLRMGHVITDLNGAPLLPGDDIRINAWINLLWSGSIRLGAYHEESIGLWEAAPIPAFTDFVRFTRTPLDVQGAIYDFNALRELTIVPGLTDVMLPGGEQYEFIEWEGRVNCAAPAGETMTFHSMLRTPGGGFAEPDDPNTLDARPDPSSITPVQPDFTPSTKTVADASGDRLAQPGETLTFTIRATNGTSCPDRMMDCECEAVDVTVRDAVDTSRLEDITPLDGGSYAGGMVSWDIPAVGADGRPASSVAVRFTARVRPGVPDGDRICNTATVTSASLRSVADGGLLEHCASFPPTSVTLSPCIEVDVPTEPFLITEKAIVAPSPTGPYLAGSTLTFAITVTNVGAAPATGIEAWDCLTSCWGDVLATIVPLDGGVLNGGTNPGCTRSWIRWSIGSLAAGASRTVRFEGTLPLSLGDGTSCTNTAFADSTETSVAPSTRLGFDVCAPVLTFTKTLPPTPAVYPAGGTIVWTIEVVNSGTCTATGIRVTDVIDTVNLAEPPAFDVPPGAGGAYDPATDTITWTLPPLAASGGMTSFTVSSTIVGPSPGTVCDRAGMTWDLGVAPVFTSPAPGTCAPFDDTPVCAVLPEVKPVKGRKELPSDVYLEWADIVEATDGYRVCRVDGFANRSDIPTTCDTPDPDIAPVCDPTAAPSCVHAGGLPGAAGSIYYYQVKGLCDAIEGP